MTNLEDALGEIDLLAAAEGSEAAPAKSALDNKINEHFAGAVVRKDLVKAVRGNAVVPSYVLEYLLGQYAASDDEATIQTGIDSVRQILATHYVNRNEHMLVKSEIRRKGRHRVIDKVTVALNEKNDVHEAHFENLQVKGVIIDDATVKQNPKLLVGGVWCICDIEYSHSDDQRVVPWILGSFKPIQVAGVDVDHYYQARKAFTSEEWIDLLMQSIGLNPGQFNERGKLIALTRLIPFVERNYNVVELGPKGTGKSHTFSEFSPNGILISGGEVTVAKLFVNNASGRIGLVGYWDCVAFDEFAANRRTDQNLVNVMKNYLANKSFSRGTSIYGAEASMAFIGNTTHTVPYMLKNSDLFDELPDAYRDPAWLDRIHHYIPGWEVAPIRSEMFSAGYGFVVDYLAEILRAKRTEDFSDKYQDYFTLDSSISTRDQDGIRKTFSGLMKLVHPAGEATEEEIRTLLEFAIEGRKRVKDSILRIDATMRDTPVRFRYADKAGVWHDVATLEESQYPQLYRRAWNDVPQSASGSGDGTITAPGLVPNAASLTDAATVPQDVSAARETSLLVEGHRDFTAGQKGVSYETMILPYLRGAARITVTDPYIRLPHQGRNLADLLSLLAAEKDDADEIEVELLTTEEPKVEYKHNQLLMLKSIKDASDAVGVRLNVRLDDTIHDRRIEASTGWRIDLGKGLDIWQRPSDNPFDFARNRQEFRLVGSAFSVHYIKVPTELEDLTTP
ncbi:BREX system Lon protease-like protein BrxL [Micrococcus terreus]|uniref:BREX system Lon protease-like protein BrxL n=1 Tax=Micrococcus terreus TaxID=574650 RepID=UPI00254DC833|nr:BREX system Lon protease-like protein BrxL [Micrococcus terreus]MDK7701791.1 BREX system Lon protease-like protein BrxL [Micrococcus terreus]WOO96731.1 BREX system Lon protease-like protein BrxL [Micrococcus terreus]